MEFGFKLIGQALVCYSLNYNFKVDALFMIAGFAGLVYSAFRRDFFILLWAIPLLIFFYFIGFVSFWHIIPLIPVFCIAAAVMIIELSRTLYNFKILRIILVSGVVLIIGITGFQHTISMAAYSNNDQYYEATTFISHYLGNHEHDNLTIMSDAFYRWIPRYVFDLQLIIRTTLTPYLPTIVSF